MVTGLSEEGGRACVVGLMEGACMFLYLSINKPDELTSSFAKGTASLQK
jgi:hypothetical protein